MAQNDLEGLSRREVMKYVRSPRDIVFLTGSRIEGLGNKNSDWDVYVVTEAASDDGLPSLEVKSENYTDFEQWSPQSMQELASLINTSPLEVRELSRLSLADIDRYYRTSIGTAVFNPEGFKALVANFSKTRSSEVFAEWSRCQAAIALVQGDALQLMGLTFAALTSLRQAAEYALDAFLGGHGEAFPSRKWRKEKLKRAGFSSLGDTLATLAEFEGVSFEKFRRRVTGFVESLGVVHRVRPDFSSVKVPSDVAVLTIGRESFLARSGQDVYMMNDLGALVWNLLRRSDRSLVDEVAAVLRSNQRQAEVFIETFLWVAHRRFLLSFDVVEDNRPQSAAFPPNLSNRLAGVLSLAPSRARALFDGMSEAVADGLELSTYLYDIQGARDAGQVGMLVFAARTLLDRACVSRVRELGLPLDPAEPGVVCLSRLDPSMSQEAGRLFCQEPTTLDDASRYAQKCIDFVERLGVPMPGVGKEEQSRYREAQGRIAEFGAVLGYSYDRATGIARFLAR